jgi:two-component system phosphate regulon sensor histidine kinase PhoR
VKFGIRGRLFFVSVALILAVGTTSAVYLEFELRRWLETRLEKELYGYGTTSAATVELTGGEGDVKTLDGLADHLGDATGARITVIGITGKVLGDSTLSVDQVLSAENHGKRPEVVDAMREGKGVSRRHSATLDTRVLYVAVPYESVAGGGVLRIATPLASVDKTVERMRFFILVAGLLGLVLATLMSFLASHYLSRRLRDLLDRAQAMAEVDEEEAQTETLDEEPKGGERSLTRDGVALEKVVATLAKERGRFGAVLESMDEAVILVSAKGRVKLVNRAGMDLLDIDDDALGKPITELFEEPALLGALKAAADGEGSNFEFDVVGEEARHLLARVSPQRTAKGAVIVMTDVTRLRRLEKVRRDFVANVSHELRTPVSVIRLNAETLRDGALTDPTSGPRFVDALLRNAERLSDLVSDLLDISRIESGKVEIASDDIDVAALSREVITSMTPLADAKSTTLTVNLPDTLMAQGDSKALEQVLVNLLQNAVKYTPEAGHVELRGRRTAEAVRLEVCDDGPGIAEKHRTRVFERFYRVDRGRSKHMGGTGLGLSIVKHLVANMGGIVGVEPNEPRGSKFWVELPLSQSDRQR